MELLECSTLNKKCYSFYVIYPSNKNPWKNRKQKTNKKQKQKTKTLKNNENKHIDDFF